MKVVIIDYGSGNLHSICKAFEEVAPKKCSIELSDSAHALQHATHIVLPGVGAFGDCANALRQASGMEDTLERLVIEERRPFFGICVGMQLLADKGYENGEHKGLGWISGEVVPINPRDKALKIPHMGWNDLVIKQPHSILRGIDTGDHAYFVHSYRFKCRNKGDILGSVDYAEGIPAIIGRGNIIATQFHPEKSQKVGLRLIENFLRG